MSQVQAAQPSGDRSYNKFSAHLETEATPNPAGKGPMSATKNTFPSHGAKATTNHPGRISATGGNVNLSATEDASAAKTRPNPLRRQSPKTILPIVAVKIRNQFITKKKEYVTLRDEITEKEKSARSLFTDISDLREKIIASGAKDPGQIEGLKIEIGPPIAGSPSQNSAAIVNNYERDARKFKERYASAERTIESLRVLLQESQRKSREFCQDAFEKHSSLIAFVTTRLALAPETAEGEAGSDEVGQQAKLHQKNNEQLKARLEEMKVAHADVEAQLAKSIAELHDDYQNYRARLNEQEVVQTQEEKATKAQLDSTMGVLQKEREEAAQAKERARQLDVLLERARTKNRELETHIASDQAKLQQLQEKMKNMDQQIKHKNQLMEQRMKAMQKTAKNNEGLMTKVEKQRDSFESRLLELKQEMNSKEREAMDQIKELATELEQATTSADTNREKRQLAESELAELKVRYQNLEEKSQQLCELAEKNKPLPLSDGNHSENEVRLFNELQATRTELEKQKEEMARLLQEKEEIVAVMHQAASRDEESNANSKLAAELVSKSAELQTLTTQYNEMKRVAKNAQERNGTLEKQLRDLQLGLHAQMVEGGKSSINAHTIELQQQVSDFRNNLVEALRQKEELESVLTQKQLELEHRDHVLRDQTKFLKIRDEMLGLLKAKDQHDETSNSDDNSEEIDQQIAVRREAIQELYKTITNKQLQVMRLEKMVKLMEDQQDRAQAQRTRLENRIAQLELALQKNKEQRSKGFGIL